MRIKNYFKYLMICFGVLIFAGEGLAADHVTITGIAYGDKIGIIHFDYKTACLQDISSASDPSQCLDKSNAAYNNSSYYIGPTKQFYAHPYTPYYLTPGPGEATKFTPASSSVAVRISTDDCNNDGCLLKGFAWSDKIGWIVFDGSVIENSMTSGAFQKQWHPKIKMGHTSAQGRAPLTGFAWNEYTGWIMLSADDSGAQGIITEPDDQKSGNWGVWLDYTKDVERVVTDPGPPEATDKLGRRLQGYAWSENLGWIKFSNSNADDQDPAQEGIQASIPFATYTLWAPDDTPPIPLAPDKLWFAAGVNSGYPDITIVPENIVWSEFAVDPESGINEKQSKIYIKELDGEVGCVPSDIVGRMTYDMPLKYDALGVGDAMRLILPGMARVQNVIRGYCKYQLHAEIWNDVNSVIYLGDHFQPEPKKSPDNKNYFDPTTIYVRAGDFSANKSTVEPTPFLRTAYADGKATVTYTVHLKDIADNPIMDIDCSDEYTACPGRKAVVNSTVRNQLIYDLTQPIKNQPIRPVKYGDGYIGGSAIAFDESDDESGKYIKDSVEIFSWPIRKYKNNDLWDIEINKVAYAYPITFASFAPSGNFILASGCGDTCPTVQKNFQMTSFNYKVHNDELPETSKLIKVENPLPLPPSFVPNTASVIPACYDDNDNATSPSCSNPDFPTTPPAKRVVSPGVIATDVARSITFNPPIITDNAKLSGEMGEGNILTLSYPAEISFDILNKSPSKLLSADESGFSIDNIFHYYGHVSAALMESHRISNETADETDLYLGWTDPFEFCPDCTRYEMYMKDGYNYGDPNEKLEPKNTPFSSFFTKYHTPDKFYFYDDASDPANSILSSEVSEKMPDGFSIPPDYLADEISSDGRYYISGLASIPQKFDPTDPEGDLFDPFNYNPGYIDRNDDVDLDLDASNGLKSKKIRFYPEKLVPVTISNLKFRLVQEIAYRFKENNQIIYTVYAAENPLLKDAEVKDVGLEAIGTVAGEQLVTGRQFDVVGTAGTRQLQEQIRRNVAEMLAGIDHKCQIPSAGLTLEVFDSQDVSGDCVTFDAVNGTMFAYYEGDDSTMLTLGNGGDLTVPDLPYTLIVKGGANVFIKSNIIYPATGNPSFGIIVIADTIGKGANTYISPDPTNIHAVLYTEGSLLSMNDANQLYYGGPHSAASGDIKDLKNQLYWRGSIASRNTIAGAGQNKIPTGVTCLPGDTDLTCAQRYDLDYLRRFTVVIDSVTGFTRIANNGSFSGGGSCAADGTCSYGPLSTVITLDGNKHIDQTKSQLATVFVEKDPATVNNPPPGFMVAIGLESIQEIR